MNTRTTAFTLIELMAVIVILAVMASAVGLTMAHTVKHRNFESTVEQIIWLDHATRRLCRNNNMTTTLIFDVGKQQLSRRKPVNTYKQTNTIGTADTTNDWYNTNDNVSRYFDNFGEPKENILLRFTTNTVLDEIVVATERSTWEAMEINVSASGYSQTYALRLIGPDDKLRWLVITGLTGDVIKVNDDSDIDTIFEMLSRRNPR